MENNMDIEKIVREYIDKSLHMSLGTSAGDQPWVCEVHFVYDAQLNLYFRSLTSRRHSQEIAANPRVAGNIVGQHALGEYPHAIYFEGTAEQITNADERQKLFPLFKQRLDCDETILEDAANPDGHQFFKISVKNWYAFGKFGGDRGNKYELKWNEGKK
jgi:uncharacterized protein YhbP (UPF0306 family)